MGKRIRNTVIVTILCVLYSLPGFAQEPDLVLTTWCGAPFSKPDMTGYLDQILIEAFKRIDLTIAISKRPAERSLQDANNGKTDGEFIRIDKIGEIYPNLKIVSEHLFDMEFVAFSTRDDVEASNWQSLAPYSVGIVRGWKIFEANVKYHRGNRTDVTEAEKLFQLLNAGRLDTALYSRQFGLEIVNRLGLAGVKSLAPPLAVKEMYLFLHKRHEKIIPALNKTLKSMKDDGTFARVREKTLL